MISDNRFRPAVLGLLALVIVAGIAVFALPGDSEQIRDSGKPPPYVDGWAGGVERHCRHGTESNLYFSLPNKIEACHCAALITSRRYATNARYQSTPQEEKSAFAKELARRCDGPPENLVGEL
jgi:hypothetical protein